MDPLRISSKANSKYLHHGLYHIILIKGGTAHERDVYNCLSYSIGAAIAGIILYLDKNKPITIQIKRKPQFNIKVSTNSHFKTLFIIIGAIIIVFSIIFRLTLFNYSADAQQDEFNQIIKSPPRINYPLINADNVWDTGSPYGNSGNCAFKNGAYLITMNSKGFYPCYDQHRNDNFTNFIYQVQMTIVSGDYGGLLFRSDYSDAKFYFFYVAANGSYALSYYRDNQVGTTLTQGVSTYFNVGEMNQIAVLAQGSNFSLYINGNKVAPAQDEHLDNGLIGLVAGSTTNITQVVYNQVQVWVL